MTHPGVEAVTSAPFALQAYDRRRPEFRRYMLRYKQARAMTLGPCMRLQFEDQLTVRYQVLEVLRAERIDDPSAFDAELESYRHLLPDGHSWRATLMLELPEALQRRRELPVLNEAAHAVYINVTCHPRVFAQANEDLPDRHRARLSGVHFLRFELSGRLRAALLNGAAAYLGCTHPHYAWQRLVPHDTLKLLRHDFALTAHDPASASTSCVPS